MTDRVRIRDVRVLSDDCYLRSDDVLIVVGFPRRRGRRRYNNESRLQRCFCFLDRTCAVSGTAGLL